MTILKVYRDNRLYHQGKTYTCALGKNAITLDKTEGDNASPQGCYALRSVLYRADRVKVPQTILPVSALTPNDGWCDDVNHADYNRLITLPHPARHEKLWREDSLYDIIVVLGHNDNPPVAGKGSAIFFHLARPFYRPTEGCIAVTLTDMYDILASVSTDSQMQIG